MHKRIIAGLVAAAALPITATSAATPFPDGHDAAYRAYVDALPAGLRKLSWLTKLDGVASQPAAMTLAGKRVTYLFACKNHSCDTDNVNIFLSADHKGFRAVLKVKGVQSLLGGAGPAEVACVRKLDAAGGVLAAC